MYLESVVSQITRFPFPLFHMIHYHSLLTKVSQGKRKMIGKSFARDWNVTGSQGNASGCVIKTYRRPWEVSLSHLLLLFLWETSASRESLQWTIHAWYPSLAQVVKLIFKRSLREKPTFRDTTTSFQAKWFLTNERRNSILMTCRYPDLGNASDWSCRVGNLLFSRGNQWWGRKMLAAFPGYGNNWRIQLSNTQFIKGICGGNTPVYTAILRNVVG